MKHGLCGTPEYYTWQAMLQRCSNPRNPKFPRYGGRGIGVCDAWRESAAAFVADMGPRPTPNHTLDRIDNDGPYGPENCRWATRLTQQRNTGVTRFATIDGVTKSFSGWAADAGISKQSFTLRVDGGWPEEKLLAPKESERVRAGKVRLLTHNGETLPVSGWAKRLGINHQTIHERLKAGYSVERALTERVQSREARKRVGT
jgi:hypothetical protein